MMARSACLSQRPANNFTRALSSQCVPQIHICNRRLQTSHRTLLQPVCVFTQPLLIRSSTSQSCTSLHGNANPSPEGPSAVSGEGAMLRSRRAALLSAASIPGLMMSFLTFPLPSHADAVSDGAPIAGAVQRRITGPLALLRSPGIPFFSKPGLTEFPDWMFGEWDVTAKFTTFSTPLGALFVDPSFLEAAQAPVEQGGMGSNTSYKMRLFSTLPDTWDNTVRVTLGALPSDAVVLDRGFNSRETTNAYLGWNAVEEATYNTREPNRQTVTFSQTDPNGRALPPKKLELYINNTASEAGQDSEGRPTFFTSDLYRQALLMAGDTVITDYEVLNSYTLISPGVVQGKQVTALYLDPRQPRFFEADSRAVAAYVYDLQMDRVAPPEDAYGAAACVLTPKGFTQCM